MNSVCHMLYRKGSYVSIDDFDIHRFIKIKQPKKTLFSRFGFGNKFQKSKENNLQRKYLGFFDENYLYFLKDNEVDQSDHSLRKVGNHYNLLKIKNAYFDPKSNDNNLWDIKLEFTIENSNNTTIKEMIFDKESAERFYSIIKLHFKTLNMKVDEK